jgi:hypothetical protein
MEPIESNSTVNILWLLAPPNSGTLQFDLISDDKKTTVTVTEKGGWTHDIDWEGNASGYSLTCTNVVWNGQPQTGATIVIAWLPLDEFNWEYSGALGSQNPLAHGEGLSPDVRVTFQFDSDGILIVGTIDTDTKIPTA